MLGRGVIIAAPSSGSGKTTITLGLLRALKQRGRSVSAAKSGPDYIDPQFHEAALGATSLNLDAWAMAPDTLRIRAAEHASGSLLIIEAAMGLFDGAPPDGRGSAADLAKALRLPVILVVNAASMAHSIAPLVKGFANFDPEVRIGGIILNNVGSPRHEHILRTALSNQPIPVVGCVNRSTTLSLPSRHLGLVQALEHEDIDGFSNTAARQIEESVDIDAVEQIAAPLHKPGTRSDKTPQKSYDSIAVAKDKAFAFVYPHLIKNWQETGTEIRFFSPLADEPVPDADQVYLPGGYPELFAETIASASTFLTSLRRIALTTKIYGECGGYMVLGHTLTSVDGRDHRMAGLLDLHTSFAQRKLHLGYRTLKRFGDKDTAQIAAHEFHFATTIQSTGAPLFQAWDAEGAPLPDMGLCDGNVSGSFAHIINPLI